MHFDNDVAESIAHGDEREFAQQIRCYCYSCCCCRQRRYKVESATMILWSKDAKCNNVYKVESHAWNIIAKAYHRPYYLHTNVE